MSDKVPEKRYLKIGEVSKLTSLNCSVLRFWETEFDQLRPLKSRAGQRLYSREDVEIIQKIKRLLYTERLTIPGARNTMNRSNQELRKSFFAIVIDIRDELIQLRDSL
jgi:DNA-binding transcriptional MerR regulator